MPGQANSFKAPRPQAHGRWAEEAARIANAMLKSGADEGEAIATARLRQASQP